MDIDIVNEVLLLLQTIVDNLVENPNERRFWSLRRSGSAWHRIVRFLFDCDEKAAIAFLQPLGFVASEDSVCIMGPPPPEALKLATRNFDMFARSIRNNVETLSRLLQIVQDEKMDTWTQWPQVKSILRSDVRSAPPVFAQACQPVLPETLLSPQVLRFVDDAYSVRLQSSSGRNCRKAMQERVSRLEALEHLPTSSTQREMDLTATQLISDIAGFAEEWCILSECQGVVRSDRMLARELLARYTKREISMEELHTLRSEWNARVQATKLELRKGISSFSRSND